MSIIRLLACGLIAATVTAPRSALDGAAPQAFAPLARHGGMIFVSGIAPAPAVTAADFPAQASAVLAELAARLAGAGSDLAHVVSTTVYLTRASDFPALNDAWKRAWPAAPPTRTTVVTQPAPGGALLQVSAIAVPAGAERRIIQPAGWLPPSSPYSYAISTGDVVFVSGLVPRRGLDNSPVAGDMGVQTRAVLDNARTILGAAGLSLADVASARVYVTDDSLFQAMNDAYRAYFPAAPPARATVRAALTNPDYLVEVTLTAVRGSGRTVFTTPAADGTPGTPHPVLSSAIGSGPRLFLSGMLGILPGGAPDPIAQTGETMARLGRTMALAGYSWSNVIDSVIYVTDVSSADAVVSAIAARVGGTLPPGTVVGAGLMNPNGRVEIMLTAGK